MVGFITKTKFYVAVTALYDEQHDCVFYQSAPLKPSVSPISKDSTLKFVQFSGWKMR